jgi:hypothetical protein
MHLLQQTLVEKFPIIFKCVVDLLIIASSYLGRLEKYLMSKQKYKLTNCDVITQLK